MRASHHLCLACAHQLLDCDGWCDAMGILEMDWRPTVARTRAYSHDSRSTSRSHIDPGCGCVPSLGRMFHETEELEFF
eukprot:4586909-Amphidinium_carterae.1